MLQNSHVPGNVYAYFGKSHPDIPTHLCFHSTGQKCLEPVAEIKVDEPFRDLRTAGIMSAEKEDTLFALHIN